MEVKWKGIECDYMGPFDTPCLNPKPYKELPSPPKPKGIQISVCVSTYRRPKELIVTSIESIYNQHFPAKNYEVILVDDATVVDDVKAEKDLMEAIKYLLREYPNHYFRAYFTNYTRCWTDAHTMNVAYKRALGWIILHSQADLIHVGETLESAWRHHNHNDHLRLCPDHFGGLSDDLWDTEHLKEWPFFPYEFGTSYPIKCVQRVKGRNETITQAPPDVDFQSAMRDSCGLVAMKDPSVKTIHRKDSHPVGKGLHGRRAGAPRYYDGDVRKNDKTWTDGDWGVLTPEEEKKTKMTETMLKNLAGAL